MNKYEKMRLEAGYSQLKLAKKSGVSRETIRRLEQGKGTPYPLTVKKIKDALKKRSDENE